MKILVVTSEVTFVPENYNHFLQELFRELASEHPLSIDLVILKNNSPLMLLKGLGLMLVGARKTGYHLIRNSFKALYRDRKHLVLDYRINIHFFKNPNSPDFHRFVKEREIDLLINARTRFLYKSKVLKLPKLGAINIHHGLLPDYRGTMCDLWALHADRPTGFTVHVMDKKIDSGPIIRRIQTTSIDEDAKNLRKNFANLICESSKIEGNEMGRLIKTIKKTRVLPIEMENISSNPTYTKNPDFQTIRKMLQKGILL